MSQLEDFRWYRDHQDELVAKYNGKVLAVKDGKVLGAYPSELEAIAETNKTQKLGTYIVQKCTPGTDAYTATFRTRVRFA